MKKLLGLIALLSLLAACGKSSSTGNATATLKFTKAARLFSVTDLVDAMAPSRLSPSSFKMKFIAAYLTEDIAAGTGNNVGTTTMIYLNTQCENDIMHCDVSTGTAEDGQPMSKIISTFFDFSSESAANTAINAQGLAITAGTFKYARLEFCKYATGTDPNIDWAYATGSAAGQFKQTSCTANSAEINPPITIAAGGTATINLTYDTSNSVTVSGAGTSNCNNGHCFQVPNFVPSATVRY